MLPVLRVLVPRCVDVLLTVILRVCVVCCSGSGCFNFVQVCVFNLSLIRLIFRMSIYRVGVSMRLSYCFNDTVAAFIAS